MQTPQSNPGTPPLSSKADASDVQVELLRAILTEVRALRELMDNVTQGGNAMATEDVAATGQYRR